MKELTVKELRDLQRSGYSQPGVAVVLKARGLSDDIPAREVLRLIYGRPKIPDNLFDMLVQMFGDLPFNEFINQQEKLTKDVWLPLALATLCSLLCANKGIDIKTHTFLSSWGLSRLSGVVHKEPTKEEHDEEFLRRMGF